MSLSNAVVVVTGGSSGIGRAAALAFAAKGATVVLAARRAAALNTVARECEQRGGAALVVPTDVTDSDAVEHLADKAVKNFGHIDVWVNCAAVTAFAPFEVLPLKDLRRILDVNVMGVVHGARAVLPHLRERGQGTLINLSSIVGAIPQPYTQTYSMSKAAVRALSASLRQELWLDGARSIKVCTVLPAAIDTPLFDHTANYTGRKPKAMPPVYSPERVARRIVKLARRPRREVVVGPMGRNLVIQAKFAPGLTERLMAFQVDRTHLYWKKTAPATNGNLFRPATGSGAVAGGWHGRGRTAIRRTASAAALVTGGVLLARRIARRPS